MEYKEHYSVLKKECLDYLSSGNLQSKTLADLTFGAGGHSLAMTQISEDIKVLAFDQDPDALANGKKIIKENSLENRVQLIDSNFENFTKKLDELGVQSVDGALMDLGVSSHHFDSPERGFSFRFDGPLDMRMDVDNDEVATAAELLQTMSEDEIANIIFEYGEDRYAKRIARAIVDERSREQIKTTKQLENIVFHCYPKKERFRKTHPATKTFQALRLHVNRELEVLKNVIADVYTRLSVGGRLCVISFHSLEDRIVKHEFKRLKKEMNAKIITKKPILPSPQELSENSRSRSAKLRVVERT